MRTLRATLSLVMSLLILKVIISMFSQFKGCWNNETSWFYSWSLENFTKKLFSQTHSHFLSKLYFPFSLPCSLSIRKWPSLGPQSLITQLLDLYVMCVTWVMIWVNDLHTNTLKKKRVEGKSRSKHG